MNETPGEGAPESDAAALIAAAVYVDGVGIVVLDPLQTGSPRIQRVSLAKLPHPKNAWKAGGDLSSRAEWICNKGNVAILCSSVRV